jgi:hypothetical protein
LPGHELRINNPVSVQAVGFFLIPKRVYNPFVGVCCQWGMDEGAPTASLFPHKITGSLDTQMLKSISNCLKGISQGESLSKDLFYYNRKKEREI